MHEFSNYFFSNQNYMDLNFYQYGEESCEPGHSFGPAKRNHYLFHYIIQGQGILMADGSDGKTNTYHLHAGEGFLIFPEQTTTYIADALDPWHYAWIEFDGLRVKEALNMTRISLNYPIYHPMNPEKSMLLKEEILHIIAMHEESSFYLIGHLYFFLDLLTKSSLKKLSNEKSKQYDFYIHRSLKYIETHYQDAITVEDIAHFVGLNRSYFGKIFKDIVGQTPQRFLLTYRMSKASELLLVTNLTIMEIAGAVGYSDPLHFSRAFKSVYEKSPKIWRNENKGLTITKILTT